jgi:hypothetical protein
MPLPLNTKSIELPVSRLPGDPRDHPEAVTLAPVRIQEITRKPSQIFHSVDLTHLLARLKQRSEAMNVLPISIHCPNALGWQSTCRSGHHVRD